MQALREDQGLDTYIRAYRFLSIRLKSRPDTEALVAMVDAMRGKLRTDDEAYEEALEQRVAMTAEIGYHDTKLDRQVLGLARQLNVMIAGNRDDARYKKLFPVAPTTMMKPVGGDEQSTYVEAIVERISSEPDFAPLKEYAKPIRLSLEHLNKAVKVRKELYVAEAKAAANRRATLDDARRAYRLMHPRLTLMFPDDPVLVESFFATFGKNDRVDADAPVVTPPADVPSPA